MGLFENAALRRTLGGTAALVLVGALAGCGGGNGPGTTPEPVADNQLRNDLALGLSADEAADLDMTDDQVREVQHRRVRVLFYRFQDLPPLGPDATYEGWVIVDGEPISTGTFRIGRHGRARPSFALVPRALAEEATAFVVTIEPVPDPDPGPSGTAILAGDLDERRNPLTVDHERALGDDFCGAEGPFILATPSTAIMEDEQQGIWWTVNMTPTLVLPDLPDGWRFEGWVVVDGEPLTTGKFDDPEGADDDGAGPTAGPLPGPPFPGQDFIDPPIHLVGQMAVITIEPEPDFSPEPFPVRILINESIGDEIAPALHPMENLCEDLPSGTVRLLGRRHR